MSTLSPTVIPTSERTVDHTDPWKQDGNIVLAADGKYFRVHRSILSTHSEVFKDMFEDCTHIGNVGEELIERCPVIYLDDAAADVQIMLGALYDRSYRPLYEKMPVSVLAAFWRMGDKYDVPALSKEAKARLCSSFAPTSKDVPFLMSPQCSNLFPGISDGDPHHFQIMNLLQEMDLLAPLPLAMYRCVAVCPLTAVLDGYEFNGAVYSLSHANLRPYIHMKDVLDKIRLRLAESLYLPPGCNKLSCRQNIYRLWSQSTVVAPLDFGTGGRLFCESCGTTLKARCEIALNDAWDRLPTVFDFETWEDVAKSGDFPSLRIHTH